MNTGRNTSVELGIVPLPMVFGSFVMPIHVGVPGTTSFVAGITANVITVSVVGTRWTTGSISASDQTASAPSATVASTFLAAGTNNLTAGGGQITLVTPYLIRIRGAAPENRAGYAVLSLQFSNVPEPGSLLLIGVGAAALLARARQQRR
jgi:hypothetical protein